MTNDYSKMPETNIKKPIEIIGYHKGKIISRNKFENSLDVKHFFLFNRCTDVFLLCDDDSCVKLK